MVIGFIFNLINIKQAVEAYWSLFLEVEADASEESVSDAIFYLTEE